MYFMLGNIAFEPVDLTDFSETHAADFAEHNVLKGKPRLQAMGEKLIELNFAIRLHFKLGGVESRYQSLLSAQAKQNALALMWGSRYKGNFVITSIGSTTVFTDAKGNVLCREMNIGLKEFVGDQESLLGAALNFGGNSLLGSVLPSSVSGALSNIKSAVNKGVGLFNQGKRLVDEVQNTVAVMRQFAHDPLSALAYLPSVLGNLDGALGCFGEISGMSGLFDGMRQVLPVVSQFSREVGEIFDGVQQMKQHFTEGNNRNGEGWDDWFQPAVAALENIHDRFDNLAPVTATMTAWIVLRTDEEADNDTNIA
ncbi:phage tail protein [Pasteurella multocida]|uniref:phage tail protein n=1 Tax=Pasteurella multocida TaxID=747 RepID=UPI002301F4FF|nr:phage tail protein [Pasteurella multocida]MDA5607075.1 phage tail protein [Pasteurella multocida subsp. multocida]MDA5614662.1 phage tail protein [Pasteurella multocida]MDA5624615.1 phage tail protein [Pasteurella multocida]